MMPVIRRILISFTIVMMTATLLYSATEMRGVRITVPSEDGKGTVTLYTGSFALLIGASKYVNGWPSLPGVKEDINLVKAALEKQGFTVSVVLDPNSKQIRSAYEDFIHKYGNVPDNRLLFYFAGHGHTLKQSYGEEMGYIIPIDAPNPNKDRDNFLNTALDMQQMEVYAKKIQSKHVLFLFDSCFSGSIFAISRAIPENISYKSSKPVRQFITSGGADETVPDKSVFREQFVAALNGEADLDKDGYVTGTELGEFLTNNVINYSKGSQHPQYGKIRNPNLDKGDFIFLAKLPPKPEPVPAKQAATPADGTLRVNSNPASAECYLDDLLIGLTPVEIKKPSGTYNLTLKKSGYKDNIISVKVSEGKTLDISRQLDSAQSIITISSNPNGAKIFIDNAYYGESPKSLANLQPGSHTVKLVKDGYDVWEQYFELSSGEQLPIQANLKMAAVAPPVQKRRVVEKAPTPSPSPSNIKTKDNITNIPLPSF